MAFPMWNVNITCIQGKDPQSHFVLAFDLIGTVALLFP